MELRLDPSLALVEPCPAPGGPMQPHAAQPPALPHQAPLMLLATTGRGELRLVTGGGAGGGGAPGAASPPVYPLRPAPPLAGVRPFTLEAAYMTATGGSAARRAACCAACCVLCCVHAAGVRRTVYAGGGLHDRHGWGALRSVLHAVP